MREVAAPNGAAYPKTQDGGIHHKRASSHSRGNAVLAVHILGSSRMLAPANQLHFSAAQDQQIFGMSGTLMASASKRFHFPPACAETGTNDMKEWQS
jgi:hypothetical protein